MNKIKKVERMVKMNISNNKVENLKIAYIGGGSRGWAWGLMSDLAACDDISGEVYLYDIDYEAAQHNEIIGNYYKECEDAKSIWNYHAVETIGEALTDVFQTHLNFKTYQLENFNLMKSNMGG